MPWSTIFFVHTLYIVGRFVYGRVTTDATEDTMTETELAQIAADTATAVTHRNWAIGEAHRSGLSFRKIAACVGMSHSGVKLIVDAELRSEGSDAA